MSTREPITHELKCHLEPFAAAKSGAKPFEWRKDDRDYRVGDTLRLREWMPGTGWDNDGGREGDYSGEELIRTVTYIIREGFGIPPGYCIMGLSELDAQPLQISKHWSDCAQHNEPAYPNGPCDCGATEQVVEAWYGSYKRVFPLISGETSQAFCDGDKAMLAAFARSLAQPKEVAPTVSKIMEVVKEEVGQARGAMKTGVHEDVAFGVAMMGIKSRLTKLLTNP